MSFNILIWKKIFSEEKASSILPVVKPNYTKKSAMRGKTDTFMGRKMFLLIPCWEKDLPINPELAMEYETSHLSSL